MPTTLTAPTPAPTRRRRAPLPGPFAAVFDHLSVAAPGSIHEPNHVLIFPTIRAARAALECYASGWGMDAVSVDGDRAAYGSAPWGDDSGDGGPRLTLYSLDSTPATTDDPDPDAVVDRIRAAWLAMLEQGDPYPDRILSVGPRGGIVEHSC